MNSRRYFEAVAAADVRFAVASEAAKGDTACLLRAIHDRRKSENEAFSKYILGRTHKSDGANDCGCDRGEN